MTYGASFKDRTAVVTGAASGMGLSIARHLLDLGARVTMVDLKPSPEELPPAATFVSGDLTVPAFVASVMDDTARRTGRIDYLVNAAGALWFGRDRSMLDIELDVWDRVM